MTFLVVVIGCTQVEYPPISSIEAARGIKSGTPLEEIKQSLGEPHPPTAKQARHLDETLARMPEEHRANAQKDQSLAWGNDSQYLVVKVNEQGVAWVTSWHSSGP